MAKDKLLIWRFSKLVLYFGILRCQSNLQKCSLYQNVNVCQGEDRTIISWINFEHLIFTVILCNTQFFYFCKLYLDVSVFKLWIEEIHFVASNS